MNKKAELKNKLIEQVTPENEQYADYECDVILTSDSYEVYLLKPVYDNIDMFEHIFYYKENMSSSIQEILKEGKSIYFWSGDLMEELYVFDLIDEMVSEVEA
tara:strand:+ start:195 stop:500 length:306 start_codon:yes stop_codon:yes gene_type:complete